MYEVEGDKLYCYPGTTVLKNKLDLKDAAELAAFEAEISSQRIDATPRTSQSRSLLIKPRSIR